AAIEINTARTNVEGFIRMVTAAFQYFQAQGGGHLAVISSIAGTKGLGAAPAYSATKRFQNTYMDALAQLSHMKKLNICFTDIRPGFVETALLKDGHYPLLMKPERVAAHIISALHRQKRVVVIDCRYAVLVFFWKLIPRCLWERLPIRSGRNGS
ncbi:MAG: SDR family NAD(P)-dependent oxidoreductase, partial [Tannerellaceae bacterium]